MNPPRPHRLREARELRHRPPISPSPGQDRDAMRDAEPQRDPTPYLTADPLLTTAEAEWFRELEADIARLMAGDHYRRGDDPGSGVKLGPRTPRPEPVGV